METGTIKKTSRLVSGGKANRKDAASVIPNKEVKTVKVEKPEIVKPIEEVKPEVKKVEQVVETPKPVLSLEQKIAKVENLAVLIEKREKLQDSRKKLNAFVIGSHQFSENIVLTDGEGNTFKTSNTEVFGSVVDVIRNTLDGKIREIETQIQF